MKSYSTFRFSSYSWNHHAGKISLRYMLDDDEYFEETILLPEGVDDERLNKHYWQIERLLFALHIIGGISYFKTCLPRTIKVDSGPLNLAETKFWNTVYEKGLGEFFYQNNIDFRGIVKFPVVKNKEPPNPEKLPAMTLRSAKKSTTPRILVPIGGGKDSMATVELLRKSGANVTLLRMEPHPIIDELSHASGMPMMTVRRMLSGNLFDLNKEGALNGHVPITAYLSILASLMALLYDFDAVAMSNERSANEGNVEYKGAVINHQWSKSVEFERMLRRYLKDTVRTEVDYFSALRPLSELKIAEIFTRYPQYFERTTSCNKNWKILEEERSDTRWCGSCPKCAFVFTCMAAFLPKKELLTMFGGNFYESDALLPLYRELLGLEKFKPFECVGTPDETKAAFLLAHKRGDLNGTVAMKMFVHDVLPGISDGDALIETAMKPTGEHFIPEFLQPFILQA